MSGGEPVSNFDEKSGYIAIKTPWGRWWQTVYEIHIEIDLPPNTRGKNCTVNIKPSSIECIINGNTVLKGQLFGIVRSDDHVWTIESGVMTILLSRSDHAVKDAAWTSLLADGNFGLDPLSLHETRKKLDLERFQIENPGMDFSNAKLAKCYDKLPGSYSDAAVEKSVEESTIEQEM